MTKTIWQRFAMIGRRFTRKSFRDMLISFRNLTRNYLAACTKGANASSMRDAPAPAGSGKARIRAKQRAFSFKSSFMTSIAERALVSRIEEYSLPIPSNQTLSEFLRQQMSPYIGRNVDDIVLRWAFRNRIRKPARAGSL